MRLLNAAIRDGPPRLVDPVLLRVKALVGHVDLEEVTPHPYRSHDDEVLGFTPRSHCTEEHLEEADCQARNRSMRNHTCRRDKDRLHVGLREEEHRIAP